MLFEEASREELEVLVKALECYRDHVLRSPQPLSESEAKKKELAFMLLFHLRGELNKPR